jgi:hypothetical protein
MPTFTGGTVADPLTTNDNWNLNANAATEVGKVVAIGWGGSLISPVAYRTRWTRPTTLGSGASTLIVPAVHGPNAATPLLELARYTGTPSVLAADPSGNLHTQNWNAFGGLGLINLPIDDPWFVINGLLQGQIACRNTVGTDAGGSSYQVTWKE